jgi:lysine-N-methylase
MIPTLPARPRLAAHVMARRHFVDGREVVELSNLLTHHAVRIGPDEWTILATTDGRRGLGVVLASAPPTLRAAFLERLEGLAAVAMLDDGPPRAAPGVVQPGAPQGDAAERPLDPLPGYTFTCDGSGICCGLYSTILFEEGASARARALLPRVLDGGDRHERVFTPDYGSVPTTHSAVALRDGRCVYLADSGLCSIHAASGAEAKPRGCQAYPVLRVDDGESVRVSPSVECPCVFSSAGRADGAPLLPEGARLRRDLAGGASIRTLPERVEISPETMAPRRDLVSWSRRVTELLDAPTGPRAAPDVAAVMASLGALLAEGGLAADPAPAVTAPPPLAPAGVRPWIEALHRRAAEHDQNARWRSERDLVRRAFRWLALASAALLDPSVLPAILAAPAPAPASEAFYLRALLHGHRLVGLSPLSRAFTDRAVRILVARALPRVLAADPPEAVPEGVRAHPLALVEGLIRGHGLERYASEV